MSLLCLAFDSLELLCWDCQCLILAGLEIKAENLNKNGIGLVDANREINSGLC